MTARTEHKFQFKASQIAAAAKAEAEYRESRVAHWTPIRDTSLEKVKSSAKIKVLDPMDMAGSVSNSSYSGAQLVVDHGDPEAWAKYLLAHKKVQEHQAAAERYRTDERVYGTQGERDYDLDTEPLPPRRTAPRGLGREVARDE